MEPDSPPTGALAPFRNRAFLLLWVGVVLSSIGSWSQTVGAQWLFINDPNAATIISLVQTATAPADAAARTGRRGPVGRVRQAPPDAVGAGLLRRRSRLLLSLLTGMKLMPPLLLLAFTFAIGVGNAIQLPTWQPLITELVPRSQIAAATRLDMVSVNVARAMGPAIAGLVIAAFGVPPVFAINAACTLFLIVAISSWRREPRPSPPASGSASCLRCAPAAGTYGTSPSYG
jgi:MFS family permease